MSHSYVNNLMHCAFSTKERYPFIDLELEQRLWPYIAGFARENKMKALAIGGTNDHITRSDPTDESVGDYQSSASPTSWATTVNPVQSGILTIPKKF